MGLLDTLIRKRDAAYQAYQEWQALLDKLRADPDVAKYVLGRVDQVANGAYARLAADAGPDQAAPPKPTRKPWTKAQRAAHADRMRAQWADPKSRQALLRGIKKHKAKKARG
jgi:hypothetical protein